MFDSKGAIRVLIFDEQPVVRFGLRRLLNDDPALTVVGEAGHMRDLQTLFDEVRPNVLLGDPGDDLDGLQLLRSICGKFAGCSVIIYTARPGRAQMIMSALDFGVRGYLLKEADLDELLHNIHMACEGTTVLAPAVAHKLLEHLRQQDRSPEYDTGRSLSERELEVLKCLAQGKSNAATAESLYICEATVKFHVHAILEKLDVRNRTQAVMKAVQRGLIHLALVLAQVATFSSDALPL
jgi:NarL family two-component system response regulator LiaR